MKPRPMLTIFICPFSHVQNPNIKNKGVLILVSSQLGECRKQFKNVRKSAEMGVWGGEKGKKNKKTDDELIIHDIKVFCHHLIILWREGNVEGVVVYLLFSTSAFI